MSFTRPITAATQVRAEARVVAAQGRRITAAEANGVWSDGKVLAHGASTLLASSGVR